MRGTDMRFSDNDLLFLIKLLMPQAEDRERMLRFLRDYPEILEGMLADQKVVHRLLDEPLGLLAVSPTLFFAALLVQVQRDLERHPYTLEQGGRLSMALFDSPQVVQLLANRELRDYLTDLLVSFVRVNSFSTTVRVHKGVWRRIRFSDFDIDSLLRWCNAMEESQRFPAYKRIADICLFTLGIFSPAELAAGAALPLLDQKLRMALRRSREDYLAQGAIFYRLASRHQEAAARQVSRVLSLLAEKIALAAKPLTVMSAKYLAPFKDKVFLQ